MLSEKVSKIGFGQVRRNERDGASECVCLVFLIACIRTSGWLGSAVGAAV